jgi:hypothetical protein
MIWFHSKKNPRSLSPRMRARENLQHHMNEYDTALWRFEIHLKSVLSHLTTVCNSTESRLASLTQSSAAATSLSECLSALSKLSASTSSVLSPALEHMASVHTDIDGERRRLIAATQEFGVAADKVCKLVSEGRDIDAYIKKQQSALSLSNARLIDANKKWDTADGARDASKLAAVQRQRYVAHRQFVQDASHAWNYLTFDVELEKDVTAIEAACALLAAERRYNGRVYTLLADVRPYIDELRTFVSEQRELFKQQQRAADERERAQALAIGLRSRSVEALMALLCGSDLVYAESLCATLSGARLEKVVACLLAVADAQGLLGSVMRTAVTREVQATTSVGTLFRGNTISTRMMAGFARYVGQQVWEVSFVAVCKTRSH